MFWVRLWVCGCEKGGLNVNVVSQTVLCTHSFCIVADIGVNYKV